MSIEGVKKTV